MRFTSAVAVIAPLVGLSSAFITGVAPYTSTFASNTISMLPVTFNTGSTMVPFLDLVAVVGVTPAASHNSSTEIGTPIGNIDFLALGRSSTGPGSFTVNVPLSSSQLLSGSGSYVLTVLISRGTGSDFNSLLARADFFNATFTATA